MKSIDVKMYVNMIEAGTNLLINNREAVDKLNVFPVPDGDTGSNMSKTIISGYNAVKNKEKQITTIEEVANVFSRGLLMGARGNSGVILSQIFKGFSIGLINISDTMSTENLNNAFQEAAKSAYKAVINPVEGTILTVINDMAKYSEMNHSLYKNNIINFLKVVFDAGKVSLENTPNLLKPLKDAGVVDSGGAGLMFVFNGFLKALENESVELINQIEDNQTNQAAAKDVDYSKLDESILNHFCTEFFVVNVNKMLFDETSYRNNLQKLGDSIVVVNEGDIVKTHVHTDTPGKALQLGLEFGDLDGIKIDNMRIQHTMTELEKEYLQQANFDENKIGIISVATGREMSNLFISNNTDVIVDGGQTANPSIGDFVNAIEKINAKNILIFPNNSNIILAAQEAAKMYEDKKILIVPTKDYTEGFILSKLVSSEYSFDNNFEQINDLLKEIKTIKITNAIKDTIYNNVQIKNGQYITIVDKMIKSSCETIPESFEVGMAETNTEFELATIFFGQNISDEEKKKIIEKISIIVDEFEIFETNQPVYPVIISFE
jgi:DAK2 domain fusion protein YloV